MSKPFLNIMIYFSILLFLVSLIILVKGADVLVDSASGIARTLGVSEFIIGATIIAVGTSLPELSAAIFASLMNAGGIAAGNVIGSNITNILLVIGACAAVMPLLTKWEAKRVDVYIMLVMSFLVALFALDGTFSRIDGLVLLVCLVGILIARKRRGVIEKGHRYAGAREVALIIIGIAAVIIGAKFFVVGAKDIATFMGVSDYAIGLTAVALGTSLPELTTALTAVRKKKPDMAVGNIVGSNIFNIAIVLGVATLIREIAVPSNILLFHIPIMIGAALVLTFYIKKGKIPAGLGVVFLLAYIAFIGASVFV